MTTSTLTETAQSTQFRTEILDGLRAMPKYLPSKYFYDKAGDRIFQEIMNCDEYYLFACELEIFRKRTAELAAAMMEPGNPFDLIELGPGDCKKSAYLLRHLVWAGAGFTYIPIDISINVINHLQTQLPVKIAGLTVRGLNGEYLPMIKEATKASGRRKVVLFLG
jgi:uncharacterized SAM-dependent methyltransferase